MSRKKQNDGKDNEGKGCDKSHGKHAFCRDCAACLIPCGRTAKRDHRKN